MTKIFPNILRYHNLYIEALNIQMTMATSFIKIEFSPTIYSNLPRKPIPLLTITNPENQPATSRTFWEDILLPLVTIQEAKR